MSKRLLIRISVLAMATVFALSGCFIFIGDWDLTNWTADLQIVGDWDSEFGNLDLHLSYPAPIDGDTTDTRGVPDMLSPYDDEAEASVTGGDLGFFIADADLVSEPREIVYSGFKTSTFKADSVSSVEMTVDDTESGEEVIVVRRPPFNYTIGSDYQPDNADIGLPASRDEYAWIGVSELYVNAAGGNIAAAGLEVTIYDANDNPLISFRPPEDASYSSASIARIHYFRAKNSADTDTVPYYLIVPDQRWIPSGTDGFRSVSGTTVDGETFVGVFGRPESE